MKITILTSNSLRHRFVANSLIEKADDVLIVSECKKSDTVDATDKQSSPVEEHFKKRYEMEKKFFPNSDYFLGKVLPLEYKEINLLSTFETIKRFKPDLLIAFGSAIIKEPLLTILKPGHFINLHLGLSPYYRGSGTNFWPFVNGELEYVGSTLLHLDAGIDTGDIISHVRPKIEVGDDVHSVGCKVIRDSVLEIRRVIELVSEGRSLPRVKQWKIPDERYYKSSDFNENVLLQYIAKQEDGLIERYLRSKKKQIEIVTLQPKS